MGDKSEIHWTDASWNPVTGCSRVSPGCANCYAETLSLRYGWSKKPWHPENAAENVILHPERLELPLRWKKPRRIFVNSMSDLFHELVPDSFIWQVWMVMAQSPQHTFQVLTKRPERMRDWVTRWADTTSDEVRDRVNGMPPMPRGPEAVREVYTSGRARLYADYLESLGEPPEGAAYPLYDWLEGPRWLPAELPNVWLGTSVENQHWADIRIPLLLQTPATVRFLSCEPLLGPVSIAASLPAEVVEMARDGVTLRDILHWVIVGGESGPGHRPMDLNWAREIRDACLAAGVSFFYKQDSGARPGMRRELDGHLWEQMPGEDPVHAVIPPRPPMQLPLV